MSESGVPNKLEQTTTTTKGRPAGATAGGVAVALALLFAAGCASPPPPSPARAGYVEAEAEAGARLYQIGDYGLAARRFRAAADEAERCGQPVLESRVRIAECTAWLRGGDVNSFRHCTARLEVLHGELGHSEPGVNTLLALGAIARGEALPPFRLPPSVRRLLQSTAAGGA